MVSAFLARRSRVEHDFYSSTCYSTRPPSKLEGCNKYDGLSRRRPARRFRSPSSRIVRFSHPESHRGPVASADRFLDRCISSFAPFITNVLLLGAMVFRNWQITRQLDGIQLPILSRMVRDGTFYSVSITLVNIVNIYFYIRTIFSHVPSFSVFSLTYSHNLSSESTAQNPTNASNRSTSAPS